MPYMYFLIFFIKDFEFYLIQIRRNQVADIQFPPIPCK